MTTLARWWINGRIYRRNVSMAIDQIIKGTLNNILNRETELYTQRVAICHNCDLLTESKIFGMICNPNLYLNPITNQVSYNAKPGFKNGCGCVIGSKARVKEAHCPLGKW
jgi:hypothetical protein